MPKEKIDPAEKIEYYERLFTFLVESYPVTEPILTVLLGPDELERIVLEEKERQPS